MISSDADLIRMLFDGPLFAESKVEQGFLCTTRKFSKSFGQDSHSSTSILAETRVTVYRRLQVVKSLLGRFSIPDFPPNLRYMRMLSGAFQLKRICNPKTLLAQSWSSWTSTNSNFREFPKVHGITLKQF